VFVVGETDCVPEIGFVPVQPPVAVHEVAFDELHANVDEPPEVIDVGEAESVTVGNDGGVGMLVTVIVIHKVFVRKKYLYFLLFIPGVFFLIL